MLRTILVREPIDRSFLVELAQEQFGDMVKAVVDCRRRIMVVGGELHADEEQRLLDDGSVQQDLWGVNLYPHDETDDWLEFDSLINIRPAQANRSRSVKDEATRATIKDIIEDLVR